VDLDEHEQPMKSVDGATIEIVTTDVRLAQVVEVASRSPRVALDTESNGLHRYPEHICLVQLAAGDSVYLIDPLAILDAGPIGELLADASVQKVMHSADYDLRSFDRDWGFRVTNLFDTNIAAAFVGTTRLGLAAVLKDLLGVAVPKVKKLQRADWTVRPLSSGAQRYAADDVLHVERLRDLLVRRLTDLRRLDWVEEECARQAAVRHTPRDPEWAFATIKGSRALDGLGLAVLRSLYEFREEEALRKNRPPFQIIQDALLVEIATDPRTDLGVVKGLGRYGHGRALADLRAAIHDGMRAAPVKRPRSTNRLRLSTAQLVELDARRRRLKEWRAGLGRSLKLDPSRLWPSASLERLAEDPDSLAAEFASREVRAWQRREFGECLEAFVALLRG